MAKSTPTRSYGLGKVKKLQDRLASAQRSTRVARAKAGEIVTNVVRTGTIGVTAFGLGYYTGTRGPLEIMGVPLELGIVGLTHGAALLGVGGKAETHLRAVGDGALAVYAGNWGRVMGRESAAQKSAGPRTRGYHEVGAGDGDGSGEESYVTLDELAEMADY